MGFTDETVRFNLNDGDKNEISNTLTNVYRSLAEKGYNPINQIVGYVLIKFISVCIKLCLISC